MERLNDESFRIAAENATKIADALLKSALKGHVLSARLLVELAEGSVDPAEALNSRPLRSLAQCLADEPEYVYPMIEGYLQLGSGSPELVKA